MRPIKKSCPSTFPMFRADAGLCDRFRHAGEGGRWRLSVYEIPGYAFRSAYPPPDARPIWPIAQKNPPRPQRGTGGESNLGTLTNGAQGGDPRLAWMTMRPHRQGNTADEDPPRRLGSVATAVSRGAPV